MSRRSVELVGELLAGVVLLLFAMVGTARSGEDPRTARQFLQALREHGFHDLALQYLDQLRADKDLPDDLKVSLDYLEGRTQIDEASKTSNLVHRRELLEQARTKLEGFTKAQPSHPQVPEALVQIARMMVERGHLALLAGDDAQDPAQKAARLTEARDALAQARTDFTKAIERLSADHKSYRGFLPKGDPRLEERDHLFTSLLDSMLQKAVAEYELAETYPPGSKERADHLTDALKQFDQLYKDYRTQLAGLAAQMWQAKCYEEQGKLGEAIGIYKALMEHTDPRVRPLQRHVGYFYIAALARRKQYALAADEAVRWLEKYSRREEHHSKEGLGVLLELAKNIDAQMPEISENDRPQAAKRIIDALGQVVRFASPYKKEALSLLTKYKPKATLRTEEIARLSYEAAQSQAEEAMAAQEWERAIALLKAAQGKADPQRDLEKANNTRYNLALCYYMNKQYYEADVLAEHLARRYPQWGLSARATLIGMQSLADAYNQYTQSDRASDLNRLLDLARYTAETWPDREQGDDARMNLGTIYLGRGLYDEALTALGAIGTRSPRWIEAQTRLGGVHWAKSRHLERRGAKDGAAAEAKLALDTLSRTLKARRDAGAAPIDPGLIGNAADLSIVLTDTGKPAEALALLDPITKAQTVKTGPSYARLMEATLMAQMSAGLVEPAIASMKALEQSGGAAGRAQLYFRLGRLLQQELDRLRNKGDQAALARTQKAFRSFLTALTESKAGQTYESLQWAGESLLTLDASAEAEKVLQRVLDEAVRNPAFLKESGGKERLLRTKLKLAAALRRQGQSDKEKFAKAASLVEELQAQYPRYVEPLVEKGMLLESMAEAEEGDWSTSFQHWQDLAQKLARMRPRPLTYYEAWYHAAWALYQQKNLAQARQTLAGVMRLTPSVGSPEMKAKYRKLLDQIK